jgi:hypothetical protein
LPEFWSQSDDQQPPSDPCDGQVEAAFHGTAETSGQTFSKNMLNTSAFHHREDASCKMIRGAAHHTRQVGVRSI